jgi:hypothetical protein
MRYTGNHLDESQGEWTTSLFFIRELASCCPPGTLHEWDRDGRGVIQYMNNAIKLKSKSKWRVCLNKIEDEEVRKAVEQMDVEKLDAATEKKKDKDAKRNGHHN